MSFENKLLDRSSLLAFQSFLECGMACDINMPCNAYHFENGNCGLALLDKELLNDVHGDDVNNKNIYLNGKFRNMYSYSLKILFTYHSF